MQTSFSEESQSAASLACFDWPAFVILYGHEEPEAEPCGYFVIYLPLVSEPELMPIPEVSVSGCRSKRRRIAIM
jgi:hypothetical protein